MIQLKAPELDKLQGVVLKPQFDPDVFLTGKPVHVKVRNSGNLVGVPYNFAENALVVTCQPLRLDLVYVSKPKHDDDGYSRTETVSVPIGEVVNGNIEITVIYNEQGAL